MGVKIYEGFTFDDVLIRPAASAMEPAEASLQTEIAGIRLTVPFLSAAMDRVTETEMAIALGKLGGLGVVHRNCSVEDQVDMVRAVKKAGVVRRADFLYRLIAVPCLQALEVAKYFIKRLLGQSAEKSGASLDFLTEKLPAFAEIVGVRRALLVAGFGVEGVFVCSFKRICFVGQALPHCLCRFRFKMDDFGDQIGDRGRDRQSEQSRLPQAELFEHRPDEGREPRRIQDDRRGGGGRIPQGGGLPVAKPISPAVATGRSTQPPTVLPMM